MIHKLCFKPAKGLRALRSTLNVDEYIEFHDNLVNMVGTEIAGPKDEQWISQTRQNAMTTTGRLLLVGLVMLEYVL